MTIRRRAFVVLAALLVLGCGKKLPPQAPLQIVPARTARLDVTQEGTDVVLRFPFPRQTATGEALTDLRLVTIYRELVAARPGTRPPPPPEPPLRAREEQTFLLRAQPVATLSLADLDQITQGNEIVARDSLIPLLEEKRIGKVFLRYGVAATRGRKETSELSPLVSILPAIPPGNPIHLLADVEERRVCLSWLPPVDMLDGTRPARAAAYAVYRKKPSDEEYPDPLAIVKRFPIFTDETALPNERYLYTVRAAPGVETPLVLGPPADEILVDTKDVFPPAAPEGLIVLVEAGANRVLWNPVLSSDLAGYRLFRRGPDGTFRLLADKLKEPSYVDANGPKDAVYGVTAVDTSGNESRRSEASAASPRETP